MSPGPASASRRWGFQGLCSCGLLLGLGLLVSCKAELLGVELPRGGPDAIMMEDLQRDTWLLTNTTSQPGASSPIQHLAVRLQQMHLLPAFGDDYQRRRAGAPVLCGEKAGRSGEGIVVYAEGGLGGDPARVLSLAGVISLAKAWDSLAVPTHTLFFCVLPQDEGRAALEEQPPMPLESLTVLVAVGELGGPELQEEQTALGQDRQLLRFAAPGLSGGTPDHRRVIDQLRHIDARIRAMQDASSTK